MATLYDSKCHLKIQCERDTMLDNINSTECANDLDSIYNFFEKRVQWLLTSRTPDIDFTAEKYVAAYDIFNKLPADCQKRLFRAIMLPVETDFGDDQTKRQLANVYVSAYLIALQDSLIITSENYKKLLQLYYWNVALNALKVV